MTDYEDEVDLALRRRARARSRRAKRAIAIKLGLALLLAAAAAIVLRGVANRNNQIANLAAGQDKRAVATHRDLAIQLKRGDVSVRVEHAPLFDKPQKPAAYLRDDQGGSILVYLCQDSPTAQEAAGAMGEGSFVYGRFAIGPDDNSEPTRKLLRTVQSTLGSP